MILYEPSFPAPDSTFILPSISARTLWPGEAYPKTTADSPRVTADFTKPKVGGTSISFLVKLLEIVSMLKNFDCVIRPSLSLMERLSRKKSLWWDLHRLFEPTIRGIARNYPGLCHYW